MAQPTDDIFTPRELAQLARDEQPRRKRLPPRNRPPDDRCPGCAKDGAHHQATRTFPGAKVKKFKCVRCGSNYEIWIY